MISTHAIFKIILYSQGQNNLSIPMDTVFSPASSAVFHLKKDSAAWTISAQLPVGICKAPVVRLWLAQP